MEKEYLNEENYKKVRNIVLAVGICLLIVAIVFAVLLISAIKTPEPEMSDPDWFKLVTQRNGKIFGFAAGTGVTFIFSLMCFGFAFKRFFMGVAAQQTMPVATEMINKGSQNISPAISNIASAIRQNTVFCSYCGKSIEANSVFCKHCGKQQ